MSEEPKDMGEGWEKIDPTNLQTMTFPTLIIKLCREPIFQIRCEGCSSWFEMKGKDFIGILMCFDCLLKWKAMGQSGKVSMDIFNFLHWLNVRGWSGGKN